MSRIYLKEGDLISKADNNLVDVKILGGEVIKNLEPRRLFPVSKGGEYITFLDEAGDEIAILRDVSIISSESRVALLESLDEYYFVPRIVKIMSKSNKYGTLSFTVKTDRGTTSFDIKNPNQDIRLSDNGRVRIRDSHDNRYLIEDYKELDAHSRALLIVHL